MRQTSGKKRARLAGWLALVLGSLLCFWGPRAFAQDSSDDTVWKEKPQHILSEAEVQDEISEKMDRVQQFLEEQHLKGLLLTQVRNFAWVTAGLGDNQIVENKDVGAASLLILDDGAKYLLANGSESSRLMDETLNELGYDLREFNWYETNPEKDVRADVIRELAGEGQVGSVPSIPGPRW